MKQRLAGGLSVSTLKWIALLTMLLDHIAYFFGFTGRIPAWFSMAGRLSAPLFIFCLAEGFAHTSNRKRYFLKIYALSVLMSCCLFFMRFAGIAVRPDGFYPQNSILTTFALLLIVWQGVDWLRAGSRLKGLLAVILPLIWPTAATTLAAIPALSSPIGILCYSLLPTWGLLGDTSLPVLIVGLMMYPLRSRRKLQALAFALFTLLYHFAFVHHIVSQTPGFFFSQMFTVYVEWMGAFAAPLMLCYNGQRGKGPKALFYAFYPAHVYVLYALSCLLYNMLN